MGVVEEGQEVMAEGEEKEDAFADLALIGAAQRLEHYEISGYTTANNLAQQLCHSAIVSLLAKSLAEEENADQLLNQIARHPDVDCQDARSYRTKRRRCIDRNRRLRVTGTAYDCSPNNGISACLTG